MCVDNWFTGLRFAYKFPTDIVRTLKDVGSKPYYLQINKYLSWAFMTNEFSQFSMNHDDIDTQSKRTLTTLSTKRALRPLSSGAQSKSHKVAPKSKKPAYKARKSVDPASKLQRVTARRSKCMDGSRKLSGYFPKHVEAVGRPSTPETVVLSSDDGSPTASQLDRQARKAELQASRFVDLEAGCSTDDGGDSPLHTAEAEDPTMGGFVVSDGHISSDECSDWADVHCARRVVTKLRDESSESSGGGDESEVSNLGWEVGAQPQSWQQDLGVDIEPAVLSPVRLDDEVMDLEAAAEEEEEEDWVEPGVEVSTSTEKGFRLSNRYLLLTYKSHLPKAHYVKWLLEKTNRPDAWIRLAHETGDKLVDYNHTHVVVDFGTRINTRNVHYFCYVNPNLPADKVDKCKAIHPNIKVLPNVEALEDAKEYIGKEDPDNRDLKVDRRKNKNKGAGMVEAIQRAPCLNVALRNNLKRLSDAAGIISIYEHRNLRPVGLEIPPRPNRPWSVELLDQIEDVRCPFGDRKIIWYVDKVGGTGKSYLSKYLSRAYAGENGFDWFCMTAVNDYANAAHLLSNAVATGFNFKGFIIDCPRAFQYKQGLYHILESFKDGKVTSTKYQGRNIEFNTPWIVVFSNFWPKTQMMSLDRWDMRRINAETGIAEHVPHDAEKAPEFRHCDTCTCNQHHGNGGPRVQYDIVQEREN